MVIRSARFSTGRGSARSLNGERKYEKEPYLGIKTGIRGSRMGLSPQPSMRVYIGELITGDIAFSVYCFFRLRELYFI